MRHPRHLPSVGETRTEASKLSQDMQAEIALAVAKECSGMRDEQREQVTALVTEIMQAGGDGQERTRQLRIDSAAFDEMNLLDANQDMVVRSPEYRSSPSKLRKLHTWTQAAAAVVLGTISQADHNVVNAQQPGKPQTGVRAPVQVAQKPATSDLGAVAATGVGTLPRVPSTPKVSIAPSSVFSKEVSVLSNAKNGEWEKAFRSFLDGVHSLMDDPRTPPEERDALALFIKRTVKSEWDRVSKECDEAMGNPSKMGPALRRYLPLTDVALKEIGSNAAGLILGDMWTKVRAGNEKKSLPATGENTYGNLGKAFVNAKKNIDEAKAEEDRQKKAQEREKQVDELLRLPEWSDPESFEQLMAWIDRFIALRASNPDLASDPRFAGTIVRVHRALGAELTPLEQKAVDGMVKGLNITYQVSTPSVEPNPGKVNGGKTGVGKPEKGGVNNVPKWQSGLSMIGSENVVSGNWKIDPKSGSLSVLAERNARITLPWSLPEGVINCEYAVEVDFELLGGKDEAVDLMLPIGDQSVTVVVNGWPDKGAITGLSEVNGQSALNSPYSRKGRLLAPTGKCTYSAVVKKIGNVATISFSINGQRIFLYNVDARFVTPDKGWEVGNGKIGFGSYERPVKVTDVRFMPIRGDFVYQKKG